MGREPSREAPGTPQRPAHVWGPGYSWMLSRGSPWDEGSPCRHRSGGRELPSGEALYPRCQHAEGLGDRGFTVSLGVWGVQWSRSGNKHPRSFSPVSPQGQQPLSQLRSLTGIGAHSSLGSTSSCLGREGSQEKADKDSRPQAWPGENA